MFKPTDLKRYSRAFVERPELIARSDSASRVLKKILKYELLSCKENFTVQDFVKHFYDDSIFNSASRKLEEAIRRYKYIYVHSYGKNGKSTFIEVFKENSVNTPSSSFTKFDFRYTEYLAPKELMHVKVERFYRRYLRPFQGCNYKEHPFYLFFEYIKKEGTHEKLSQIQDADVQDELFELVDGADKFERRMNKFTTSGGLFNMKKLLKNTFRIFNKGDSYLLNLLISIQIFYKVKYLGVDRPVFIFDNLDDVYTYVPELVNVSYTANVIGFVEKISAGFSNIFVIEETDNLVVPVFVFVYRTNNFLSTLSFRYSGDDSPKSRIDLFNAEEVHTIKITSVKNSFGLIDRRLNFYQSLCRDLDIKVSKKFEVISSLMMAFHFNEERGRRRAESSPSNIFRLWNGNKLSFIDFVLGVDFNDKDRDLLLDDRIRPRIKSEIFFHYFIRFFHNKAAQESPISKFIGYTFTSFNNNITDRRCSLARLFFTYIHNRRREDYETDTAEEIFNKGVPLEGFINDLSEVKNDMGVRYSLEDLEVMFRMLFSFEIDNWGNFFSCCASTNQETEKYSKEKFKWVENIVQSLSIPEERKKIRFFDNDSAMYFMSKVKRSFEYYSYSIDKNTLSLPDSVSYTKLNNGEVQMLFKEVLDRVYDRVEEILEITIEFFEESFKGWTVSSYCNSRWAYGNRMYFSHVVSTQIDYIDAVRMAALSGKIVISGDFERYEDKDQIDHAKQQINLIFTENILKYIILFEKLYKRCMKGEENGGDQDFSKILKKTSKSIKEMRRRAEFVMARPSRFDSNISKIRRKN